MKVNNKRSGKPFGDLVIGNVFLYEEEAFIFYSIIVSDEREERKE